MASPFLKIYTSSESVTDADYLDINYSSISFFGQPQIIATTDNNINVFITNVTATSARINFSTKYTGTVKYSAISMI